MSLASFEFPDRYARTHARGVQDARAVLRLAPELAPDAMGTIESRWYAKDAGSRFVGINQAFGDSGGMR